MAQDRTTPLGEWRIGDIREIKDFTGFLRLSPEAVAPEDLWSHRVHATETGFAHSTFTAQNAAPRFSIRMTCGREEMRQYKQFRSRPYRLPAVFNIGVVSGLLMAAPGSELEYLAALGIACRAERLAADVCTPQYRGHRQSRDADPCGVRHRAQRRRGYAFAWTAGAIARLMA